MLNFALKMMGFLAAAPKSASVGGVLQNAAMHRVAYFSGNPGAFPIEESWFHYWRILISLLKNLDSLLKNLDLLLKNLDFIVKQNSPTTRRSSTHYSGCSARIATEIFPIFFFQSFCWKCRDNGMESPLKNDDFRLKIGRLFCNARYMAGHASSTPMLFRVRFHIKWWHSY